MSNNPCRAFKGVKCDSCGEQLEEGEDLFYTDSGKLCLGCAEAEDYVCPCGQYKKPDFDECYECHRG